MSGKIFTIDDFSLHIRNRCDSGITPDNIFLSSVSISSRISSVKLVPHVVVDGKKKKEHDDARSQETDANNESAATDSSAVSRHTN